jgi:hypothetical protein
VLDGIDEAGAARRADGSAIRRTSHSAVKLGLAGSLPRGAAIEATVRRHRWRKPRWR